MMATDYLRTSQLHRAPTFTLVVDGRDISKKVEARLCRSPSPKPEAARPTSWTW